MKRQMVFNFENASKKVSILRLFISVCETSNFSFVFQTKGNESSLKMRVGTKIVSDSKML